MPRQADPDACIGVNGTTFRTGTAHLRYMAWSCGGEWLMNRSKIPVWSIAGGLIILQMIMVAIIVHGESLTFDEGDHIFAGYMMWHSGDYGLNPEHPPLVKL